MPVLTDAELKMVAEIVTELAKHRGRSFDQEAKGEAFARAALIDPAFKAKLAEVYQRIEARRATKIPDRLLVPIGPLFRDLERHADLVLRRWKPSE